MLLMYIRNFFKVLLFIIFYLHFGTLYETPFVLI